MTNYWWVLTIWLLYGQVLCAAEGVKEEVTHFPGHVCEALAAKTIFSRLLVEVCKQDPKGESSCLLKSCVETYGHYTPHGPDGLEGCLPKELLDTKEDPCLFLRRVRYYRDRYCTGPEVASVVTRELREEMLDALLHNPCIAQDKHLLMAAVLELR